MILSPINTQQPWQMIEQDSGRKQPPLAWSCDWDWVLRRVFICILCFSFQFSIYLFLFVPCARICTDICAWIGWQRRRPYARMPSLFTICKQGQFGALKKAHSQHNVIAGIFQSNGDGVFNSVAQNNKIYERWNYADGAFGTGMWLWSHVISI